MYVIELAIAIFIAATLPKKQVLKSDNRKKDAVLLPEPVIELSIDGADHFYNAGMWLKKPVNN